MKCLICENDFIQGHWTDTHGVAICASCGVGYRILHRDDEGKLLDKEPELLVKKEWIPKLNQYKKDNPDRLIPAGFNFPGSSYEMCSADDSDCFNQWLEAQDITPKNKEVES